MYALGVASFVVLASGVTQADITPGPLYDFRAVDNSGEPGSWTNLGTLGGSLGVAGNQPVLTAGDPHPTDNPSYYSVPSPGSFDILSGGGDVTIPDGFSYEIYLRRTAENSGGGEHQIAAIAEEGGTKLFLDFTPVGSTDGIDLFLGGSNAWKGDLVTLPVSNEFTHIVLTFDDNTDILNAYVNGGAPTVFDFSADVIDLPAGALNNVTLFKARGSEPDDRRFAGDISVARLYDFVLSDQQVLANYQATVPEPSSLGLVGLGLLSVGLWGRRRRR
jgi:hypothetical protein